MSQVSLLNELIDALSCLPSVGRKTAQRMAYNLLDKKREKGLVLAATLENAMRNIGNCSICRNYTEQTVCHLCENTKRDKNTLCIVHSPSDVLAIESTANFSGKYFVLLGQLSPLDGIGPEEIGMSLLSKRLAEGEISEVIVATSSTVEGEATAHYISQVAKQVEQNNVNITISVTRLAQGVPVGGELEYLDQSTLALSLANRSEF
ncbi:MAG: recombination protein RecR [Kangiella sp.]|nr:MAG: recombination protein RecR [Kangiella sp.]